MKFFLASLNFSFFQIIEISQSHSRAHCENCGILLPQFFRKFSSNYRFTKELYNKLIWRKKICVAVNFSFFHTVQSKVTGKDSFAQSFNFTEFLRRDQNVKNVISTHSISHKKSVKSMHLCKITLYGVFTNFFLVERKIQF